MNFIIANTFKDLIQPLPFVDVLAGLTRVQKEIIPNESGQQLFQTYPVECSVTSTQISNGDYIDLGPDSSKKSILYFEDLGTQFKDKNVREMVFISRLRLVGWMNLDKFVGGGCSMSAQVVANIISVLTANQPFNIAAEINLTKVRVTQITELAKNSDIFLKYSYKEEMLQHLMYPFDYFALEIATEFTVPMACIPDIEMKDPQEC